MADNSPSQPPRDFRSLRDLLVSSRDALPKRLAQVAAYAIESPDDIAFGTAASIAENAAVQPSTLVRFAKALGYQGFTELQSVFQERLRDRPSNYDDRLQSLVSHAAGPAVGAALIEGFSSAAIRSVEQMRARVDAATLEEACRLLANAETIYLIAQRRAYPITSYMSYAFGKLGIKTVLIGSASGTDVETLSFAGPKDAAFAVSFTPYASATVDFARQVGRQNVPLVVITDSPFSPLVPEKGVWFEVVEADFEGFRSLAATMSLALSLTVGTAEMRRTKPE